MDAKSQYNIVQKISVVGAQAAAKMIDLVGMTATKSFFKISKGVMDAKKGLASFMNEPTARIKKMPGVGDVIQQFQSAKGAILDLAKQKLNVPSGMYEFIAKGWELNEAFEHASHQLVGLTLGMTKLGSQGVTGIEQAEGVTEALMERFKQTGIAAAIAPAEARRAFERNLPFMAAMGKSFDKIADASDAAAKAAKVYGRDTESAMDVIVDLERRGRARAKDPFGLALAMTAHIKKTDTTAQRVEKVNAALKKMAMPIKAVTKGTDAAIERWRILTDDVIRRSTMPLYEKLGSIVSRMVDGWMENKGAIDNVIDGITIGVDAVSDLAEEVWSAVKFFYEFGGIADVVAGVVATVSTLFKSWVSIFDIVTQSFRVIKESIKFIADPSRGMGKLDALFDGLIVKLLRFVKIFADWLAKIPGAKELGFTDNARIMSNYVNMRERELAKREKEVGLPEEMRTGMRERGMKKKDLENILKTTFGTKRPLLQMDVDKIEIHNDYRDLDEDRVMIETVQAFERLGHTAVQSAISGRATTYGPTSSV